MLSVTHYYLSVEVTNPLLCWSHEPITIACHVLYLSDHVERPKGNETITHERRFWNIGPTHPLYIYKIYYVYIYINVSIYRHLYSETLGKPISPLSPPASTPVEKKKRNEALINEPRFWDIGQPISSFFSLDYFFFRANMSPPSPPGVFSCQKIYIMYIHMNDVCVYYIFVWMYVCTHTHTHTLRGSAPPRLYIYIYIYIYIWDSFLNKKIRIEKKI